MSYYSKYTSIPILEDVDIENFIKREFQFDPNVLTSKHKMHDFNKSMTNLDFILKMSGEKMETFDTISTYSGYNTLMGTTIKGNDGEEYISIFGTLIPVRKVKALKTLTFVMGRLLLGFLINRFVDMKLSKFTINTLTRNMRNKKFVDHLRSEIAKVYLKNKNYTPCSGSQFKDTDIFNYMLAEYRDKTAQEIAKKVTVKSFDILISVIVSDAVNIPAGGLLAIPLKALMTYAGINLNGFGAVYHLVTDLGGQAISMDLILHRSGFVLNNMSIYCFNKYNDLIEVPIKEPPYDTYKLTVKEAKQILSKFSKAYDINIFKKDVKKLCMN